jgi:hypothetical protein
MMALPQRDFLSIRRWLPELIPASIVVLIVGAVVAVLAPAVIKARNDAMSAATT